MLLPAGQEYCWLTCSVLYRVVVVLEVARGNWCLLEEWYLKPQDSWPKKQKYFTFGGAKRSGSDRECKYFPLGTV